MKKILSAVFSTSLLTFPLSAQQPQSQPQQQQPTHQPSQQSQQSQSQPTNSQAGAAPSGQPRPKSQKESEALRKVQTDNQAQNWDAEITDINAVLENFADTDYKILLLNMGMDASQRKGDAASVVTFGERIMQADPKDVTAHVALAEGTAQRTRENDLDKDQSIKKIRDYANGALANMQTSTPPAGVSEAQWPDFKKQLTSQAYDALGQADELDKKYPDAITHFKSAIDAQPENPVPLARLSKAYVENKQYDDAITTADKVLAMNAAPAQIKQFAQAQKDSATKLKTAK